MRTALLLVALLLLATALPSVSAAAPRPNLLVIMTDDQRADGTMAVMPETRRRIGRQGTTYREAHVTTPKCCPSRASFFTGQYAHNHGVLSNVQWHNLDHRTTVQHILRRRGYRTGIFGKFLNGWPVEANPPFFDEWAVTNGGYARAYWNLDGRVRTKRKYTTDLISDRTVRFIRRSERNDRQPWLAWVTPYAPHLPSTPATRDRDAPLPEFAASAAVSEPDWSDKPSVLDRARGYPHMIETMNGDGRRSLIAVDRLVARVLDELRRLRETRDTLVIFTSDNGFMLGEHGGLAGKDLPYPASTRVPLLVRWPGRVPKRRTTDELVTNLDVTATLFDAARVRRAGDGRSLVSPREDRTVLFMEHHGGSNGEPDALPLPPWRSLFTADFRFAEYYEHGELLGREYYDRRIDRWELDNRVDELDPAHIEALSQIMDKLATCRGRACP